MISGQTIENAKQLMTALAVAEAQGNRQAVKYAWARAQNVAAEINADPRSTQPTSTLEVLALQVRQALRARPGEEGRGIGLIWMAALALEMWLEPDDVARHEAAELLSMVRR